MSATSFFAFAFRMKYINRWGLMKNSRYENLTEHSAETAMLAHALAIIGNKIYGKSYDENKIALFALYHDVSEIITGDLPTPVKYFNSDIKNDFHDIEDHARRELLNKLPEELKDAYEDVITESCSDEEKRLIKAADKLSALIKCIEEVKNGNSEFARAHDSSFKSLEKFGDLPEVKYFIDNMLPSFYLTLDEL